MRALQTILFVCLSFAFTGACAGSSLPSAAQATSTGRIVIQALAAHADNPSTVSRLAAADFALAAVSAALGKQDSVQLKAAAPCAATALEQLRPDAAKHSKEMSLALEGVIGALRAISDGAACAPDADEDAGVASYWKPRLYCGVDTAIA